MSPHARNNFALRDDEGDRVSLSDSDRDGEVVSSTSSSSSRSSSIKSSHLGIGKLAGRAEGAARYILDSPADEHKVEALWSLAQEHLRVYQIERYAGLDVPEWVPRVSEHHWQAASVVLKKFTVRNLVNAMFACADEPGLDGGKRYVAAAVCACAIEADKLDADGEDKEEALAWSLQALASTWASYLLWPFFARRSVYVETSSDSEDSGIATPTQDDVAASGMNKDSRCKRNLRNLVFQRDGFKCVMTGCFDVLMRHLKLAPQGSRFDKLEYRLVSGTSDILRHYCQLPSKYLDTPELLDTPQNAFSLIPHFHRAWDAFHWCLHPTAVANCYAMKIYNPSAVHTDLYGIPTDYEFRFKDHSNNASGKLPRNAGAVSVDPPDPDLLRLHAALAGVFHSTGAARVFHWIVQRREPGDPPVPSADGESFMERIVDPQGHQLWQSVAAMWSNNVVPV
ncbi:hypothetical protein C8Q76DRAFT_793256 [Earliella scabrosa]|nr:hypothetical protein C8Q76DRAFT_793256 [Earliella scabrosa]